MTAVCRFPSFIMRTDTLENSGGGDRQAIQIVPPELYAGWRR
jgi:hypothetical protein